MYYALDVKRYINQQISIIKTFPFVRNKNKNYVAMELELCNHVYLVTKNVIPIQECYVGWSL